MLCFAFACSIGSATEVVRPMVRVASDGGPSPKYGSDSVTQEYDRAEVQHVTEARLLRMKQPTLQPVAVVVLVAAVVSLSFLMVQCFRVLRSDRAAELVTRRLAEESNSDKTSCEVGCLLTLLQQQWRSMLTASWRQLGPRLVTERTIFFHTCSCNQLLPSKVYLRFFSSFNGRPKRGEKTCACSAHQTDASIIR